MSMSPVKAVREHLEVALDRPYVDNAVDNRIREALDALDDVGVAYRVGRIVLMRPMVVHQAIHDWHARVEYRSEIYTASGDTASEALVNLSREVFDG